MMIQKIKKAEIFLTDIFTDYVEQFFNITEAQLEKFLAM